MVTGYGSGYVTVTDLRVTGLRYVRPPYKGRNIVTTSLIPHMPTVAVVSDKLFREMVARRECRLGPLSVSRLYRLRGLDCSSPRE